MLMNFKAMPVLLFFISWLGVAPAAANVEVLACEPEWAALAQALGGDKVKAESATTAFQDPHHIEARPSLIVKARRADMLFCTGAELEVGWLPLLLQKSTNAKIQPDQPGYFLAAEQVDLIEKPVSVDRSQGDVHADGNPHVHWDPYRLLTIAVAFRDRLQVIDPENDDYYQRRYEAFASRWSDAITGWEARAASLQGVKVFVHHKNWSYLLDWLKVEAVGDLEPKPGIPPTGAHLSRLLNTYKHSAPMMTLIANYQDDKGALWLRDRAGIPVVSLPFTVGGSETSTDLFTLYDDVLTQLLAVP